MGKFLKILMKEYSNIILGLQKYGIQCKSNEEKDIGPLHK